MSDTILTKSNKADRSVEVEKPDCLKATDLQGVIELIGEAVTFSKVAAQLTIDFRSHIRSKLESETNEQSNYDDEAIINCDYSDWKPEARTRKSAAEKAKEQLGKLNPSELKALLESMQDDVELSEMEE